MPCVLSIQVHPRGGRTEVVGWHGEAIKIRVKAAPVDGAANEELVRFLAKSVGVARNAVEIAGGATGRHKRVRIHGLNREEAVGALGL